MITKRAKRLVVVATICGFVSVAAFGAAFVYVSVQGKMLRERAQAVADHAVQQQTYQALATLLTSTQREREELMQYVLTEDATIDFLAEIESMAAAEGVTITTDALTVENGKDFNTLKASFSLEGDAAAIHAVVAIMETLPYMSYINRLELNRGVEADATATVELWVMLAKS
jgi:hypothetical protein